MLRIAFLIAMSASASAEPAPIMTPAMREMCVGIGEFAATLMQNRQTGVPMSSIMARLPGDDPSTNAVRAIVISAYEVPRWGSPEFQANAIADFRNAIELQCYLGQL